ncbi:MAG TPA: type II toxin-antitoxin system MqsA family antitoxin [Anaerolineales bacterium]|nr:type II toxin-antitoxin system MqsA family antitoxin [Anaerolineales bacterium]
MICLICRQAEAIDGLTSVNFERGEMRLLIKNVPAHVCPSCGEAYLDEAVAVRLLRDAEEISKAGMMDGVIEYNNSVTLPKDIGTR